MLNFKLTHDNSSSEEYIETSISGKLLLTIPQLNKGTAFTESERQAFELIGKLPVQIETLEEQVKRAYWQFQRYETDLQKNIYLNNLHDKNHVLFYKLIQTHLVEMIPLIYTPIVGTAVKQYSREFRQARGLYIAYPYADRIEEILDNRSHPEVDLIVVTDGEGVLGIGDQGVGAMDIPVAKLMLYTLCGGINPLRTLPIMLDVGTNNEELLQDPLYLGLRHKRIRGAEYDVFISKFIQAIQKKFPRLFLQWEDFGRDNARRNLEKYRHTICSFNDDVQGTGVVTMAAILAATQYSHSTLRDQRIIIFGAGTAGTGIADQIAAAMEREGLSLTEARERILLVDRFGLITALQTELTAEQRPYAHPVEKFKNWKVSFNKPINLLQSIKNFHPTILIGCSAQSGAFDKKIIREMSKHVETPIIMPLSNPTEKAEAQPTDILKWSKGRALIATGSPFENVVYEKREVAIAQCNNALVFPGIGLGAIAVHAKEISDDMLWAACTTLRDCAPILQNPQNSLLPATANSSAVARKIAIAVAKKAFDTGLATCDSQIDIEKEINRLIWRPHYIPLRRIYDTK